MTVISSTTDAGDDMGTAVSTARHEPTGATGRNGESTGSGNRLLWLALGLGVAYLAYKQIPQGRRYLRIERM